ncbi:orotidine-5'-phosphate decarboxylase [Millisia brevis]|uniref:orotidine-5'-phosphate decarboxylase n=1 Tax=Millisia brevis TaxID=264148 RepID=UPI000832F22E|nr:orotidine-5'-phosphate decarboxylase [Millisia brevis]
MSGPEPFVDRLGAAVERLGPLCVGLDPHPALLERWGLPVTVDGLERFAETVVAATAGQVAVVKPQVAFFEPFGSAGLAVLERVIARLRESGTLVIADVKRGDVGSTMAGYARAWLGPESPLYSDAMTASPYLGFHSLDPAIDAATAAGGAVFVLARNSNPEATQLQSAVLPDDDGRVDGSRPTIAQHIVDRAAALDAEAPAPVIGLVVGATGDDATHPELAGFPGPVLAPGLGAQGATAADIARRFANVRGTVLPAASRSVLAAGPAVADVTAAALRLRDELADATARAR